jgi:hypothetical protein
MADEFVKGFGILTGAGLVWMVLAGWYNTPEFHGDSPQLLAPPPETLTAFDSVALTLKEAMFWFAIAGALFFWVVVPAVREAREAMAE